MLDLRDRFVEEAYHGTALTPWLSELVALRVHSELGSSELQSLSLLCEVEGVDTTVLVYARTAQDLVYWVEPTCADLEGYYLQLAEDVLVGVHLVEGYPA